MRTLPLAALTLGAALLGACAGPDAPPAGTPPDTAPTLPSEAGTACAGLDSVLTKGAFVVVAKPWAGTRVAAGEAVTGCSRTFESTVNWRLLGRAGAELGAGTTTGGGVDGPGPFTFALAYTVAEAQRGTLEVFEADASDGEGFPPPRTVIPLVLVPAPAPPAP